MRILDRIISFIFSIIMLMLSIILILAGTGVIESQMIIDFLASNVFSKEILSKGIFNPITITGIVIFVLSLKTTIFLSLFKVAARAPVTVKTKNGEVQIAIDTIINTSRTATMMFENVREANIKVLKKGKGVIIKEDLQVYSDTSIKELTEKVQREVKDKVTATTGVTVHDVNIEVKGIFNGKRPEPSEPGVVYDKITGRPKTVGSEPVEEEYVSGELKTVDGPVKPRNLWQTEPEEVKEVQPNSAAEEDKKEV